MERLIKTFKNVRIGAKGKLGTFTIDISVRGDVARVRNISDKERTPRSAGIMAKSWLDSQKIEVLKIIVEKP